MNEPPLGVQQILRSMVNSALARCAREGIDPEEWFRVLQEEGAKVIPEEDTVLQLFERTFARFRARLN